MSKTLELAFKTNLNKTAKLQFPQVNVVSEVDAKALWIILLNLIFYNLPAHLLKPLLLN